MQPHLYFGLFGWGYATLKIVPMYAHFIVGVKSYMEVSNETSDLKGQLIGVEMKYSCTIIIIEK